jgi:hypothetical protein
MLYPGAALDVVKDVVSARMVTYPERTITIWGLESNWIVVFVAVSLLAGVIFSRVFKIEI